MKEMLAIFLLLFSGLFGLQAQEILINEDPKITQLNKTWTNNNRATPHISGWRVQIMATTDRLQIESARTRFRTENPDLSAEWVLEKPYYKLRVGAFRTKQEALALLPSLSGWSGAYPVKDANIHPRDFLEQ